MSNQRSLLNFNFKGKECLNNPEINAKNIIKIGKSCNSDRTNEYKNMEVLFIIPMPNVKANKFEDLYKSLIPKEYKYRNEYYYIFNHVIDLQVNPDEFLSNFIFYIKIIKILFYLHCTCNLRNKKKKQSN